MPYLTPQALPESDDCRSLSIPADTEWLALFGGALTELLFTWNWEQSEGGITVTETIAVIQGIIDAWYASQCGCELPEGGAILRIDLNGNFEQLIDGEWQEPQGDYEIPPPEPRTEPTSDERRCAAAANAANVLQLLYEDVTDSFSDEIGYAAAIFELSLTIGVLLAPPLGLAARSFLAIATIIFRELFDLAGFITADTWTTEFNEKLVCLLLGNAVSEGDVVTFDYANVVGDLFRSADLFDWQGSDLLLAGQITYLLNIIGQEGLNLAGATTAVDDADCSSCLAWCYEVSLSELPKDGITYTLNYGFGQQSACGLETTAAGAAQIINAQIFFPAAVITDLEFEYTTGANKGSAARQWDFKNNGVPLRSGVLNAGTGFYIEGQYGINVEVDEFYFSLDTQSSGGLTNCGNVLRLRGEGGNPFPESNCT